MEYEWQPVFPNAAFQDKSRSKNYKETPLKSDVTQQWPTQIHFQV